VLFYSGIRTERRTDGRRGVFTIDYITKKRRDGRTNSINVAVWSVRAGHNKFSSPEIYLSLVSFIFGIKVHQSMSNDLNITHSLPSVPFNVTLHPPAALAISSAQLVTNRQSAGSIILSLEAGWNPLRISERKYFMTTAGLSKWCTTL
jgi:hypothetical protein